MNRPARQVSWADGPLTVGSDFCDTSRSILPISGRALKINALGLHPICTYRHGVAFAEIRAGTNQAAALTGRGIEHSFQDMAAGAYRHVHMGLVSLNKMLAKYGAAMNMVLKSAVVTTLILSQGCAATRKDTSPDSIITKFAAAVEKKDVEGFTTLFLNDDVAWLAVVSDKDLNGAYKDNPNKQKVNEHGLVNFIEMAASTEKSTRVEFSDCRVMSDGDIASANCMYSFHLGGKKTNDGREGFLFVKTESGWKISGMVFSSRLPEDGS